MPGYYDCLVMQTTEKNHDMPSIDEIEIEIRIGRITPTCC